MGSILSGIKEICREKARNRAEKISNEGLLQPHGRRHFTVYSAGLTRQKLLC